MAGRGLQEGDWLDATSGAQFWCKKATLVGTAVKVSKTNRSADISSSR